jgi:tripartite-type tricarboxylate transporter receptor subunit TctC
MSGKTASLTMALAIVLGAVPIASSRADSVADFYKNKTLIMAVDSAAGGVNDVAGRLVARYMVKYLPGNPRYVVQNILGARGIAAVNHLYNVAPQDGTTIAIVFRGIAQAPALDNNNIHFDPQKFIWLGSTSSYGNDAYGLMIMADRPIQSWQDLKQPGKKALIGALRSASTNLTFALFARDTLKLNLEIIRGYDSAAEMFLAMQRGEIDGQVIGLSAAKIRQPDMWRSGKLRTLIEFARETRHPELPDVPTGRELVSNPDDLALLAYAEAPFRMALPFLAPPGVPADRARALQDAFMKANTDAEFKVEAEKQELDVSPIDGAQVAKLVADAMSTSPAVIERFKVISDLK